MAHRRIDGQSGTAIATPARLRRRSAGWVVSALLLSAALAPAATARAGALEGIAGWEGDSFRQGYGFATLGFSHGVGGHLEIPLRLSASYLYYDYRDGLSRVSVRAPGASLAAGLRSAGRRGSIAMLAGGEVRWERRRTGATRAFAPAVARGGIVLQGEGELRAGRRFRPVVLVSYSGSSRYVYGRSALRWQCGNLDWSGPATWLIGVEGVGQGNRDTDAFQAGATIECSLARAGLSLSLHGGVKSSASTETDRRVGGYLGAGLYRRF
jgi:hypothetical protein